MQLGTTDCISTLQTILINTDPSPALLSTIFTPIASALYTILGCLGSKKTADPTLKETIRGLLGTWARIVSAKEVEEMCWRIIEGEGGYWKVDIAGEITQTERYFFVAFYLGEKLIFVSSQARGDRKTFNLYPRSVRRS